MNRTPSLRRCPDVAPDKDIGNVQTWERDALIGLGQADWPNASPILRTLPRQELSWRKGWPGLDGTSSVWRPLPRPSPDETLPRRTLIQRGDCLVEGLVRFPAAPVYGTNREVEHQLNLSRVPLSMPPYFTLRIYRNRRDLNKPARRIYLAYNGLNELDDLTFYHTLAGRLILDEAGPTALIVHAFPGHLQRYPIYTEFAEQPLARYVADPGELFRQYLRFMLETRWLLSLLVPLPSYSVVPGADLEAERTTDKERDRRDNRTVAVAIEKAWKRAYDDSKGAPPLVGDEVERVAVIERSVSTIRRILHWEPSDVQGDSPPPGDDPSVLRPTLHCLGYSLGGYAAQSVFFTWPFAISSCTTMCSGVPLGSLRIVKFAHEQEWQSVMHGLRYELESAMVQGDKIQRSGDHIAGVPDHLFSAFLRIFYDVFLQDYRGAYGARVSEFVSRLLFFVGGADPMIPLPALGQAATRGGVNLIEVAKVGHFLAKANDKDWLEFWFPETARIIAALARRSEALLLTALRDGWWNTTRTEPYSGVERKTLQDNTAPPGPNADRPLTATEFQQELDAMAMQVSPTMEDTKQSAEDGHPILRKVDEGGYLFIARNRVPLALWGSWRLHRRGTVPHFEDVKIVQYWLGMENRHLSLRDRRRRVTLIIPDKLKEWAVNENIAVFSGKHEAFAHRIPDMRTLKQLWAEFVCTWGDDEGALRRFLPNEPPESAVLSADVRIESRTPAGWPLINTLPDAWIAFSRDGLEGSFAQLKTDAELRDSIEGRFVAWARDLRTSPDAQVGLGRMLRDSRVRIVTVSSAEFDPEFMGTRIGKLRHALEIITHCALALEYSRRTTSVAEWQVDCTEDRAVEIGGNAP